MIVHDSDRKNVTVKQSEVKEDHLILQFGTFAKASKVMDFLSDRDDSVSFNYYHNPTVERYDAELAITFQKRDSVLFSLFGNFIGVDLWEILSDEVAPSNHPVNVNS